MNKHIAIICVLALTGCISPQEMELRKKHHCANLGAPEGSKNYYECRKDLEYRMLVQQKMEQDKWRDFQAMQAAANPPIQPIQYQPPVRQSMNCQSYRMGHMVNTNCS